VLIVGGGDGGVAREVAKHPLVETIDQVEIDDRVIELSKKYLPFMAEGFNSPKLNLHVADGFKFMEEHVQYFDVIITDSSDPIGNVYYVQNINTYCNNSNKLTNYNYLTF
jgi:spermidine synthase